MDRLVVAVWLALITLAVPAVAFGQSPTEAGYGGEGGNVQEDVAAEGVGAPGGALPFTGLDLLLMVLAAALLVAAGITIRRLARART